MTPEYPENESGLFDYEREQWEAEQDPAYLIWLDFINSTSHDEEHEHGNAKYQRNVL